MQCAFVCGGYDAVCVCEWSLWHIVRLCVDVMMQCVFVNEVYGTVCVCVWRL